MNPLLQLVLARMREFFREPSALFWTFGFPTLLTLALGVAFRGGTSNPVPVIVLPGPAQAQRVELLAGDARFAVTAGTEDEAGRAFAEGNAVVAVTGGLPVTYRYDPVHPEADSARRRIDEVLQRAAGRTDPLATADEEVSSPGARYIEFLVPGLLGMNIMSGSMWGIGWVIVEARKRKLLKRLMATPLRRSHFLLSFVASRMIFLFSEACVITLFAWLAFDVEVRGGVAAMAALALAGAMAFAGLGFLAAARTENTETVSGLMNLVMLPMFVFSGVFFSAAHFPGWMQPFIRALPLTVLNDAMRQVFNQGAGLLDVAGPLAILAAWTVATFGAAIRWFRWV